MPRWARWSVALVIGAIALTAGPRAHAQATVILSCGTPPATLALGTVQPLFQDATGKLCTGATLTGGSTTLNATSTLPTLGAGTQTPQGSLAGASYVQEVFGSASGGGTQVDATHGLPTNCIAGCAGGTSSNASDAVATSSTNGQALAWLYAFNGSAWDRLTDDASRNLNVHVNAALPAGSNTIGAVTQAIGPWTVNLAQIGGGTVLLRQTTMANSLSVAIASDQSAVPISAASLPLPTGAATSALQSTINATLGSPFQAGGSIGNTAFNVGGLAASGASISGNPLQDGGRAQSSEATAVTNGQAVAAAFDLYGKQITSPWANRENYLSGTNSTTGTGATTIIAAQTGLKIYVTSAQCFRTDAGTTMDYVTLNDAAATTIPVPAGGGAAPVYSAPLSVAASTALTFAPNAGVSTMFCNAQGFKGAFLTGGELGTGTSSSACLGTGTDGTRCLGTG